MNDKEYKELSKKEFSKAARVYETDKGGIYKMCRKDYPDILAELEKEDFTDLLDCGCGTGGKACAGCMPEGGFQHMGVMWEVVNGGSG